MLSKPGVEIFTYTVEPKPKGNVDKANWLKEEAAYGVIPNSFNNCTWREKKR